MSDRGAKPNLEDAILLAVEAHRGQRSRGGEPLILHPLRVMARMETETERIVAVLHDVVEDTDQDLEDLRRSGYDEEVVEAVDHLTRRPGEPYEDFIHRAMGNPVAHRVKIADMEDNIDLVRNSGGPERDTERLAKYRRALELLTAAQGRA